MNKRFALLILVIGCFFAIYSFKTPETHATKVPPNENSEIAEEVNVTTDVSAETQKSLAGTPPANQYSESTLKKISTLKEILASKNDNDPRMDTELKNLSSEDKDALVNMYQDMKPESLNDKGTIAFLIGREMTRPEDAEFLKNILSEQPCLSLENCGITNGQSDPHMDAVNDVTLNYPQIVALNRIKTYVQTHDLQNSNPNILNHLMDAVKIGQNSKIPMVQARSEDIANLLTLDLTKARK